MEGEKVFRTSQSYGTSTSLVLSEGMCGECKTFYVRRSEMKRLIAR